MCVSRTFVPLATAVLVGLVPTGVALAGAVMWPAEAGGAASGSNLVTWHFAGEVRAVADTFDRFEGGVVPGTPFSGSFTFDLTTPDSEPDNPVFGIYEGAIISLTGFLAEFSFVAEGLLDIHVVNDIGGDIPRDSFSILGRAILVDRELTVSFGLSDLTGTMFSTIGLPVEPPSLDGLSFAVFGFNSQEEEIAVGGDVTSLVPEPGTSVLVALGYLMVVWRSRTRSRALLRTSTRFLWIAGAIWLSGPMGTVPPVRAQDVFACMDMVFLVDVTRSFTEESRARIAEQFRRLVEQRAILASGGDLRLGFITFGGGPGLPDVNVRHTLTCDVDLVLDTVDEVLEGPPESGGGVQSLPEPSDQALAEMLGPPCPDLTCRPGVFTSVPFRGQCVKHAILITDNLPEGCGFSGFQCPQDKDFALAMADEAAAQGIILSAVLVNNALIDCDPWRPIHVRV